MAATTDLALGISAEKLEFELRLMLTRSLEKTLSLSLRSLALNSRPRATFRFAPAELRVGGFILHCACLIEWEDQAGRSVAETLGLRLVVSEGDLFVNDGE